MTSTHESFALSIGIATFPRAGPDPQELLRQAEDALAVAVADGADRTRAIAVTPLTGPVATTATAVARDIGQLGVQRRETRARLQEEYERGQIDGIAIETQAGACPICLDAARDLYLPNLIPPLPLTGCIGPAGCRCLYAAPPFDPHRHPPPLPPAGYADLDIPPRLHGAALFGSSSKGKCQPEDLADYLDNFPLLPMRVEIGLQSGEVAYVVRPARRAWEAPAAVGGAPHGPPIPIDGSYLAWVRQLSRPPTLPHEVLLSREEGTVYLTNWRLIFALRQHVDSVLLADVRDIEYLHDAVACLVGQRSNRLVFMLRDALQVGLCFSRAVRDIVQLTR